MRKKPRRFGHPAGQAGLLALVLASIGGSGVGPGLAQVETRELPPPPITSREPDRPASPRDLGRPQPYRDEAPRPLGTQQSVQPPRVAQPRLAAPSAPSNAWSGLSMAELETMLAGLKLPSASPAFQVLIRNLFITNATPPAGEREPGHFAALQLEVLFRSGLADAIIDRTGQMIASASGAAEQAIANTYRAKAFAMLGQTRDACEAISAVPLDQADSFARTRAEAIVFAGFCALEAGRKDDARLLAELARDQGAQGAGPDLLAAAASGRPMALDGLARPTLLEFLLIRAGQQQLGGRQIAAAGLPVLTAIAHQPGLDAAARAELMEAVAGESPLAFPSLARAYQDAANAAGSDRARQFSLADGRGDVSAAIALYRAAVQRRQPWATALILRGALTRASDPGTASRLPPDQLDGLAEIAIRSGAFSAAAGFARALETQGRANLWPILAEIGQPRAAGSPQAVLDLATRAAEAGAIPADALHRLVTVLDALGYLVPIPLWDAASRTPQPTSGHLPDAGVLPALAEAAERGNLGHTVLLAMVTLGPGGPEAANLLALNDALKALARVGLDREARLVGLEALLSGWPGTIPSAPNRLPR